MILSSVRARVTGAGPETVAWAKQVADLVSKKTGATAEVAARISGHQDLIWVTRYEDLAAY